MRLYLIQSATINIITTGRVEADTYLADPKVDLERFMFPMCRANLVGSSNGCLTVAVENIVRIEVVGRWLYINLITDSNAEDIAEIGYKYDTYEEAVVAFDGATRQLRAVISNTLTSKYRD